MSAVRAIVCLLSAAFAAACAAAGPYAGSEACRPCHPAEYARQVKSHHAGALRPILESPVAEALLKDGSPGGVVSYRKAPGGLLARAGDAGGFLEWAFGAGAQGITPVGRVDGQYFEHRFSLYTAAGRVALTFGHPAQAATPRAALGLPQSSHTITTCFECHATGVEAGPDLSNMRPGVQCERCHGPGRRHVELAAAGASAAEVRRAVLNPGRLPAKAQVEVCGQCHRLPDPGDDSPEPELENPVAVRFAPIGLLASRCLRKSKRLACTTCHDPHEDARPRTDASYARRCAGCHAGAHQPARGDCLECHMRRASIAPYLKFTDHRIRVYR